MKRFFFVIGVSCIGLGIAGSKAESAQKPGTSPTNPYSRPTVSPYINLLRRGNLTENYFGLTRPQVQFQNDARRLQQEITETRQEAAQDYARRDLPVTGHATSFLNTGGYFLGRGGRGPQTGSVNTTPSSSGKQTSSRSSRRGG